MNQPTKKPLNRMYAIATATVVAFAAITSGCKITDAPIAKKESVSKTGIPAEKQQQAEVLIQQLSEKHKDEPLLYAQVQSLKKRLIYLCSAKFADDAKLAGLEPNEIQTQLFGDLMETLKNPKKLLSEEMVRKQLFTEISPHLHALVDQYTQERKAREKIREKEETPHTKKLRGLIDVGNAIGSMLLRNNFDPQKIRKDIEAFKREADAAIATSKANTFVRSEK